MNQVARPVFGCLIIGSLLIYAQLARAETFRVATYNVENYLDEATETRRAKPAESKAKVRDCILALKADVLALQEMGSVTALDELRASLKNGGADFPHWVHVTAYDTNIHLAVLSKFPFSAVRLHTNDAFLLDGRRLRVKRGFAEVKVQVTTNYSFTLITAHLKSKVTTGYSDESELRLEEAKVLREKIDAVFAADSAAKLIVLGDLNDTPDAKSTKAVVGRGKLKLVDTRPAERNGDTLIPGARAREPRTVAWTHFYAVRDTYSRFDYVLLSPAMAREWVTNETYVLSMPNWGVASDHRPLVVTFTTGD